MATVDAGQWLRGFGAPDLGLLYLLRGLRWFLVDVITLHHQRVAAGLLACGLAFLVYYWIASDGLPSVQDQTEPYFSFLGAENHQRFGILKGSFIQDYSTSRDPAAHPYYYTHNPDFPIIYSYLLLQLGLDSLPAQNFTAIFVLLLGFFYMYKLFVLVLRSPLAGLVVLLIAVTDYLGSLAYGANLYRSWTWPVIFGAVYHVLAWDRAEPGSPWRRRHLLLGLLWLFLGVYYDYGVALLLIGILLLLPASKLFQGGWRRAGGFLLGGAVPSFALHSALVIAAVGTSAWATDLIFTATNRAIGRPTREFLEQFYSDNSMVLWGLPEVDAATAQQFITVTFVDRIQTTFGLTTVIIGGLAGVVLALYLGRKVVRRLLLNIIRVRMGSALARLTWWCAQTRWGRPVAEVASDVAPGLAPGLKLIAVIMLASALTWILLPGQTLYLYIQPFVPFFVVFFSVLRAIVLWTLLRVGIAATDRRHHFLAVMAFGAGIGLVLEIGLLQGRNLAAQPPEPLGSAQVLDKFRDRSTITNYQFAYTRYFTKEWSTVVGWNGEVIEPPWSNHYLFERDKADNRNKYQDPEYLVLQAGHNQALPSTLDLRRRYKLVEQGDDFAIFHLRREAEDQGRFPLRSFGEIKIEPEAVTASSINRGDLGPSQLVDGDFESFWHIRVPNPNQGALLGQARQHWVQVDLQTPRVVAAVGVVPRLQTPGQFWGDTGTRIKGSDDGENWTDLAQLKLQNAYIEPTDPGWVHYQFNNAKAYRYYRISTDWREFKSLAELRLYTPSSAFRSGAVLLTVPAAAAFTLRDYSKLETGAAFAAASSSIEGGGGPAAAFDLDPNTFWHVSVPKQQNVHWLSVALGRPTLVRAVTVTPRVGQPGQFWDGDHALLQGSEDGIAWTALAFLAVDRARLSPAAPERLVFEFPNSSQYSFYRLLVSDEQFHSLAELELFTR
jgi:hypothetical protein